MFGLRAKIDLYSVRFPRRSISAAFNHRSSRHRGIQRFSNGELRSPQFFLTAARLTRKRVEKPPELLDYNPPKPVETRRM